MTAIEKPTFASTEVDILGRLLLNGKKELTRQRARDFLELDFSDADKERMRELNEKSQHSGLTNLEQHELVGYAKAGCLLGILHSRARRVLKKSPTRRSAR